MEEQISAEEPMGESGQEDLLARGNDDDQDDILICG